MGKTARDDRLRIGLLFTRYPVPTETFLQREVAVLKESGFPLSVLSLWPGTDKRSGLCPDATYRPLKLLTLLYWLPYWMIRRPSAMAEIVRALLEARRPNFVNFAESLLGIAYAITEAQGLRQHYDHLHAVWASAPATAAWALSLLIDIPFSMAGHAYDIFEDGGDGLLEVKIPQAAFIRTSTAVARERWIELGAEPDQVVQIRRGLTRFPEFPPKTRASNPLRILGVGRLVEKMGFSFYLEALAVLRDRGLNFTATLVGDGSERTGLEQRARELGIDGLLTFTGALPYDEVEQHYRESDVFLFTGRVARSGDRAGFPNAIGEAMAWGLPVLATPVGAVEEGILDGETGLIVLTPKEAAEGIQRLSEDETLFASMRQAARTWVESAFDARKNMGQLIQVLTREHPQSLRGDLESTGTQRGR